MAVIVISTSAEMAAVVNGLANDVIHARFYYDLLIALAREFEKDPRIYNESKSFWGSVSTALRDAVLVRLTRAYDQDQRSLSLVNWLDTIRANLALFEPQAFRQRAADRAFAESLAAAHRIPNSDQLDTDRNSVSDNDPLVLKLIKLRHNGSAHVAAKTVAAGIDPFRKHALHPAEYLALLERAKAILNRYSSLFQASTFSDKIVGADDYLFVVRAIQASLNSRHSEFGEPSIRVRFTEVRKG